MYQDILSRSVQTDALVEGARNMAIGRWCSAAAVTILFHDTIITFGDEVEFLWPKKWGYIKIIIYLNRCITFSFTLTWSLMQANVLTFTNLGCKVLFSITSLVAAVSFALANWIMLARTMTLYRKTKPFRYSMISFYFAMVTGSVILATLSLSELLIKGNILYVAPFKVCGIAFRPTLYGYIYFPALILEAAICFLTVVKTYQKATDMHRSKSNLFLVLYRDGVAYYVIVVALRTYNTYAWMTSTPSSLYNGFW
ncbi:hypothetical protein CPB86DRAFT_816676 [Serendipita vermifera]|nr:hypothetical protein CPB86DRAFT_816676 [Serendipita vermifera]